MKLYCWYLICFKVVLMLFFIAVRVLVIVESLCTLLEKIYRAYLMRICMFSEEIKCLINEI